MVRLGDGGIAKGDRMQEVLCMASIGTLCREKVERLSRKKEMERAKAKRNECRMKILTQRWWVSAAAGRPFSSSWTSSARDP